MFNGRSELLKMIDQIVLEKTFTGDMISVIAKLKEKAELDEKSLLGREKELTLQTEKVTVLENQVWAHQSKLAEWDKREAELKAREVLADKAVYNAERDSAVAAAYKFALETVFKPNSVRESVYESINKPIPTGGGGYMSGSGSKTKTVERSEG